MSTDLLLIRHGVTEWNVEGRYQGHLPTPLSPAGIEQSQRLAARLRDQPIQAIYSSDLPRAAHTARIVGEALGLEVLQVTDLRERDVGSWQGLTMAEIRARDSEGVALWQREPYTYLQPGAEAHDHVQARVADFLEQVVERHQEQQVALITHGGPIKAAVCYAMKVPLPGYRHIEVSNASITIIRIKSGRWVVVSLNDTCHLDYRICWEEE